MKFTAHVTIVEPTEKVKQVNETEHAKTLILEAFRILTKHDISIAQEAEEFLKGVDA